MCAYFAGYIDGTGLHLPTYNDIYEYLLEQYTAINGQSVTDNISTTDIQSISNFALMINDSYMAAQAVFNGMSPSKAIGAQQDSLYKLNGIARQGATYSICPVTITGTPYFEMINRIAMDANGNLWDLPSDFIIPATGTISVTATCETPGAINAAIGAINVMSNPVSGWTSVYNSVAATPGTPVESDSSFRARQAMSVSVPSLSLFQATLAKVGAVSGVTRVGGVENPTGAVDPNNGTPPHSISVVVEGGADADVAQAIYLNKTPGCLTNGSTPAGNGVTVNVSDPITGQTMPISFYRPTPEPIKVTIKILPLAGYTTATATAIQNAIVDYLNSLAIGEVVSRAAVLAVAMNVNNTLTAPSFSIDVPNSLMGLASGTLGTADISMAFNQVAQGIASNITVST